MKPIAQLMNKDLVEVQGEKSVLEVIEIMREKKVGSVLIKKNDNITGIFTERDIRNKINLSNPSELFSLQIKEVMTRHLKTVDHQEMSNDVLKNMRENNIRHIPVAENGKIIGIVSMRDLALYYGEQLEEILQEKEENLKENVHKKKEFENRFQVIFDNSAVGITLVDNQERIVAWNAFTASMLGMEESELMLKPVKDLYPPEEWEKLRSLHIRQQGMRKHFETKMLTKKKELIDIDISISVVEDETGQITDSIGIIRDIRERRQHEAQLQEYREQLEELVAKRTTQLSVANEKLRREIDGREKLEEALQKTNIDRKKANDELAENEKTLHETIKDLKEAHKKIKVAQEQLVRGEKMRAVGVLAGGVAHEVKNPLGIIIQGVNYLSKTLTSVPQGVTDVLDMMRSSVKRADGIICGLVDFSRTTAPDLQPSEINPIIEKALTLVQHQVLEKKIIIQKELSREIPMVLANERNMEQVFVNVLLNAIHALSEKGHLTVRSFAKKLDVAGGSVGRRSDDYFKVGETAVIVEIEDAGTGLSEENLEKAFDPFFSTKGPRGGAGLGLAVTKNIIDMHNGFIEMESEEGKGTKVIIGLKNASKNETRN